MEFQGFGVILLFLIGGLVFISITMFAGRLLRPNRPNEEKLTTYESGEDPVSSAWGNFNVRFYVIALVFLLFEVELVFLFPWALVFGDPEKNAATGGTWGWFALIETFIFVGLLVIGLLYVWKKGMLDWVKPEVKRSDYVHKVPMKYYEAINKKYGGKS
jgi:NADH-quinone oxidoreductase subunit A